MAVMIDSNWHCRGVLEITRRNRQVACGILCFPVPVLPGQTIEGECEVIDK